MKKFMVNCMYDTGMSPVAVWVGVPKKGTHPLFFQSTTISNSKGGSIVPDVMSSIEQLNSISVKYNIPLDNLVLYSIAIGDNSSTNNNEAEAIQND